MASDIKLALGHWKTWNQKLYGWIIYYWWNNSFFSDILWVYFVSFLKKKIKGSRLRPFDLNNPFKHVLILHTAPLSKNIPMLSL